ncbi:N-acetylmannosamine-6-phosphate 2-epimerase [Haloplasma contractile]|uniref:Putative N-acetylmannosamine-6-phosphate 2-epimerase n=1 Tax=Haloplasma contractile SSD-17B TaxID=1033810 RepID=U2FRQ5_9MOLU|nr:N-acetylmannosamine-6-phosphate 2-epimerase [Haloplasma contractile]ERJ13644.1 Putative N-acetylmannosamine-6-phosphate 2-epimerase protein [Haloplasma contractile SSD-17B]
MKKILKQGLIVSCQALEHEPLHSSYVMSKMATAAVEGGAIAIRANGYDDVVTIKQTVNVPVIGLIKRDYEDSTIFITPTIKEVNELAKAGCDVIALDATLRKRPEDEQLDTIVNKTRELYPDIELMADIATFEEAINADHLGFDYISTTLSGYTEETKDIEIPNLNLVKQLDGKVKAKVIAEGGIWTLVHLKQALDFNAYGAVIGSAITRPQLITKRFNSVFED